MKKVWFFEKIKEIKKKGFAPRKKQKKHKRESINIKRRNMERTIAKMH